MRLIYIRIALLLISINYYIIFTISRTTVLLIWHFMFNILHLLILENPEFRSFIGFKINSIRHRPCVCISMISRACCESVTVFYTGEEKRLCFNMMYQTNGLNFELTLDTLIIKSMIVANYRPFKICSNIPGLFFSSICISILELKQFTSAITVCPRIEIYSKKEHWHINYICSNISTALLPTDFITSETMITGMMVMMSTVKTESMNIMNTTKPIVMNIMNTTKPVVMNIMNTTKPVVMNTMATTKSEFMDMVTTKKSSTIGMISLTKSPMIGMISIPMIGMLYGPTVATIGMIPSAIELMPNTMGIPSIIGMISGITPGAIGMMLGVTPGTTRIIYGMTPATIGLISGEISRPAAMVFTPKPEPAVGIMEIISGGKPVTIISGTSSTISGTSTSSIKSQTTFVGLKLPEMVMEMLSATPVIVHTIGISALRQNASPSITTSAQLLPRDLEKPNSAKPLNMTIFTYRLESNAMKRIDAVTK